MSMTPEEYEAALEAAAKAYIDADPATALGPLVLAVMFDLMLFGVIYHQMLSWISHASKDRMMVKIIVAWSSIVSIATTGYGFYFLWHNCVAYYGIYRIWVEFDKLAWYPLMAVAATIPCQTFYAERAYRLNHKKWWMPASITPFALASVAGAVGIRVTGARTLAGTTNMSQRTCFYVWVASTLVTDLLITAFIVYGLSRAKTGWSDTDSMINKLYKITLESQFPPTCIAIAFMISYGINADSTINGIFFVHSKTYSVCLLATLNSRLTFEQTIQSSHKSLPRDPANSYPLSELYQQRTVAIPPTEGDYAELDEEDSMTKRAMQ